MTVVTGGPDPAAAANGSRPEFVGEACRCRQGLRGPPCPPATRLKDVFALPALKFLSLLLVFSNWIVRHPGTVFFVCLKARSTFGLWFRVFITFENLGPYFLKSLLLSSFYTL